MNIYEEKARKLRRILHQIPERSMNEVKTKRAILDFLETETSLTIHDCGTWFYAQYHHPGAMKTIAFRADYDAVTGADGKSQHLCGHDGHSAVLAAFGKWISDTSPKQNVILIFQPGEESGEGAKICRRLFAYEKVDEIYGFHNIPGHTAGTVLIKHGTFACASVGLEIVLHGKSAHAAYPETGNNPGEAIAEIILQVNRKLRESHRGMILSTVIGIQAGSNSYGVSASEGTLRLTIRAEYRDEFVELLAFIREVVNVTAEKSGLTWEITEHEGFPSTENTHQCVDHIAVAAGKQHLPVVELKHPFRWSEDFGWYLQEKPGAFFGIGVGENWPELHTESYEFNDEIIGTALATFQAIL